MVENSGGRGKKPCPNSVIWSLQRTHHLNEGRYVTDTFMVFTLTQSLDDNVDVYQQKVTKKFQIRVVNRP